jgi:hypothetical protein
MDQSRRIFKNFRYYIMERRNMTLIGMEVDDKEKSGIPLFFSGTRV